MKSIRAAIFLLFVVVLLLVAGYRAGTSMPAPKSTPTNAAADDFQTPIPVPSVTPIQSTAPPGVSTRLNTSGPFLLFKGEKGIWVSNPDGSFLTKVTDLAGADSLRRALLPKEIIWRWWLRTTMEWIWCW